MALWPDAIILEGVPVALGDVIADVTIHHGRKEITDEPTATTCQLTILDVDPALAKSFRVGAPLALTVRDGAAAPVPRFTGTVTDASIDVGELTIVAVGRLATLRRYKVGDVAWPVETWSARVVRMFTEAGLAGPNLVSNGEFETDTSGWAVNSGAFERTTAEHKNGAASLHVGSDTDAYTHVYGLTVGRTYKARAWGKTPGAGSSRIVAYNESFTASWNDTHAGTGAWVYHEFEFTPDTAHVIFYVGSYGSPPGCYFDAVQIVDPATDVLELYADPLFDPPLAARDPVTAGATTLGNYLAFLAPMVGAAITDRPDGRILVQALGARSLDGAIALDPADVAYAPVWVQVLPAANIVTVRYTGDQSQSVTVRDDSSVARFGERPRTIDTSFTAAADATTRANEALARGAAPRWNVLEAPVLKGLTLSIGQPVQLSGMPPTAPYDPWTPIVEGWQDSLVGGEWVMALALSDPLESGLLVAWNTVPPGETWATIDQAIAWNDVNSLDDLIGA